MARIPSENLVHVGSLLPDDIITFERSRGNVRDGVFMFVSEMIALTSFDIDSLPVCAAATGTDKVPVYHVNGNCSVTVDAITDNLSVHPVVGPVTVTDGTQTVVVSTTKLSVHGGFADTLAGGAVGDASLILQTDPYNGPTYGAVFASLGDNQYDNGFVFVKSRTTDGIANATVHDGDYCGKFVWKVDDGANMVFEASIGAQINGTPADHNVPLDIIVRSVHGGVIVNSVTLGFYNHAGSAQPLKANHNNWAAVADIAAALADLGLIDSA